MSAIKTKDQQNHSTLKFLSTPTTMNSRRRHPYLGSSIANADVDMNTWKQNAAQSQVRKISITVLIQITFSHRNEHVNV